MPVDSSYLSFVEESISNFIHLLCETLTRIVIPAVINLSTPLYNKIEPELFGIPFFIGSKRYGLPFVPIPEIIPSGKVSPMWVFENVTCLCKYYS